MYVFSATTFVVKSSCVKGMRGETRTSVKAI